MLRRDGIAHAMVFAARPAKSRRSEDTLHAWVEVEGARIIGDLPGEWIETARLGQSRPIREPLRLATPSGVEH